MRQGSFGSARFLPLIALALLALIWGYTWVPLKIGVAYSDPFVFAALRTLPGGIILMILVAATGRSLRPKGLGLTAIVGVLQTTGFMGLTIAALVSGGAGRTAILANTWQFWILLMAWPVLGERLRGSQWLSVLLALGGLILIIEPWKLRGVLSSLLTLAGAFCWAAGAIAVKILRKRHEVDLLSFTAWQGLIGSIPLVLIAIFVEGTWPVWSGEFVFSLVFTLLGASVVAAFLWLYVLQEMPASLAGLGTMGTPVVGLLMSWAQLGEQPTALESIGMVVILAGMGILFARAIKETTPAPIAAEMLGAAERAKMLDAADPAGLAGSRLRR